MNYILALLFVSDFQTKASFLRQLLENAGRGFHYRCYDGRVFTFTRLPARRSAVVERSGSKSYVPFDRQWIVRSND